jgi:trigger factor
MSTVELNSVSVERGEGGLVTLQIEVSPGSVKSKRDHVLRQYGRQIRVSGFRPGKIPANIVLRTVGEEAVAQQVSDEIVPEAYAAAVEQEQLQPLNQAQVDQLSFEALKGDAPFAFTARFVNRPAIELPELTGLSATRTPIAVTDEDLERGLEALRNENATLRAVEGRGAQDGDVLSGELTVYMNGEAKSEEPARLRQFVLGESGFVPSIDEHLVGAQLDEERRFPVSYPEDFKDEELKGQEAEFAVKITAIRERVLPEIDDEFSQRLGIENVEALRERMKQAIVQGREREEAESVRSQLAKAAAESVEFETPTAIVAGRIEGRLRNMEFELSQREATIEDYLQSIDQTREEFDAQLQTDVESEIRQELVLEAIARREEFVVLDEEIEQHYRMLAQMTGRPLEDVVRNIDLDTVRASILQRKAVDWLVDNAQINEAEAATSEVVSSEEASPEASSETAAEAPAAEATPAAEETPEGSGDEKTEAAPTAS